jgi:hypothetical protein
MQPFYTLENFRAETCLGYLLRRVYKLSVAQVEAKLEDTGVGMTQWIVLSLVDRGIATTCRALSRNMGHDSGAMSRFSSKPADCLPGFATTLIGVSAIWSSQTRARRC